MIAAQVIRRALADGLELSIRRGGVSMRGPSSVRDVWREHVRQNKPEIIALLQEWRLQQVPRADEARRRWRLHDDSCTCQNVGQHFDCGGSFDGWAARKTIDEAIAIAGVAAVRGLLSTRGRLCSRCGGLARCYDAPDGRICTFCVERLR